ncbi:MAG: SDR family oxidoreductase [Bryobacteraceae bacterium]
MPVSLKDQVALVIGASSGIGRSIAVALAGEGCRIVAAARRTDRLENLREELERSGATIQIQAADASQPAAMQALAEAVLKAFGRIDIMVYATGTNTPDRGLERLTPPIWDELILVNLNGAYYATSAVLPVMREQQSGHLIYISSISGMVPDLSGAAYQASKRGLLGLAGAIRVEEKQHGIRTCVVCPGLVETEILERRPVKPTAEILAKALQPEDVAETVVAIAKLQPRAVVPEIQLLPTYL